MHDLRGQKGMTAVGWLFTLLILGFIALTVLRLAPVYMDYYEVAASMDSLQHVPEITQKNRTEIRNLLQRRFDMNNIDTPSASQVKITDSDGVLDVKLTYDVKLHYIGNISLVVHFNKEVQVIAH